MCVCVHSFDLRLDKCFYGSSFTTNPKQVLAKWGGEKHRLVFLPLSRFLIVYTTREALRSHLFFVIMEEKQQQEEIYRDVIQTLTHKDAVMAVRHIMYEGRGETMVVDTKQVFHAFQPVEKVMTVNSVGPNLARGKFAKVVCAQMITENGAVLGGESKVVFKTFVRNKRCGTSASATLSTYFVNELIILKHLKGKSPCDRLCRALGLVRTQEGVIYTRMTRYSMGNLKAVLTLGLHRDAKIVQTWLEDLWSIGAQLNRYGIVHRDIRPRNICVHLEGTAYRLILMDWKYAYTTRKDHAGLLADLSIIREDDRYQPPEVCLGSPPPLPQHGHDMWGIACIMEEVIVMKPSLFDCEGWVNELVPIEQIFVDVLDYPRDSFKASAGVRDRICAITTRKHRKPMLRQMLSRRRGARIPPLPGWLDMFTSHIFENVFNWNPKFRFKFAGERLGTREHQNFCTPEGRKRMRKKQTKKRKKAAKRKERKKRRKQKISSSPAPL